VFGSSSYLPKLKDSNFFLFYLKFFFIFYGSFFFVRAKKVQLFFIINSASLRVFELFPFFFDPFSFLPIIFLSFSFFFFIFRIDLFYSFFISRFYYFSSIFLVFRVKKEKYTKKYIKL